jgi:hypothetical protein
MNARTLKALRGSIKKWEAIVAGTGEDKGADSCPLCNEFIATQQGFCAGCPVRSATGKPGCLDTPYMSWYEAHGEKNRLIGSKRIHDDDTAIAAVLELEFLRSLLPGSK